MGKPETPVNVEGIFDDNTELQDYYTGKKAIVKNGQLEIKTNYDIILLGEPI